jgi:hypothetical protein
MDEQILELTRQITTLTEKVTVLNERLPNHISWTERNVKDHENRLRDLEQVVPRDLREQLLQLNQFRWIMLGVAVASGGVGAALTKIIGG